MKLAFDPEKWTKAQPAHAVAGQGTAAAITAVTCENHEQRIVFEDDSLLVVEKPAGIPVQTDKTGSANLLEILQKQRPSCRLYLVHRLDRPVFGLVVFAKSAKTQTELTRQMSRHEFRKNYRCVVENGPANNQGALTDLLSKQENRNISEVVDPSSSGHKAREARLSYQVLARKTDEGRQLCLLQIELDTGRHHQIRVQLSHAGWPIIGDRKYNPGYDAGSFAGPGRTGLKIALQASCVRLIHPENGQQLQFQASIPREWPWNLFAKALEST